MQWLGGSTAVKVAGLAIRAPLTYFYDGRIGPSEEPAAIDSSLPLAPAASHSGQRELGYWPTYTELTPTQRRIYLEWLATHRRQIPPELGYVFLFIYGLERRALLEYADHGEIFDETLRLRAVYNSSGSAVSRSFDSYTSSFLWFLSAAFPNQLGAARIEQLCRATRSWSEENLGSMLAYFTEAARPLPAWAAYAVAETLPLSQRSVVTRRVGDQFRSLFAKKYATKFPEGLALRSSKRSLVHRYRPANAALAPAEVQIANVMGVSSQFKPLSKLWNETIDDLRQLSSVVGRGENPANTPEAWAALPPELRAGVDHPCCDAVNELILKETRDDGRTLVSVTKLAAAIGDENVDRFTPGKARRICEIAGHVGYCVEPDARLTGKGYRGEEVVALFLRMTDDEADPTRYAAASCMLRAGMAMAAADGEVHPSETALLMQQLRQAFELSEEELRRLESLRVLLEQDPSDLGNFGRAAKALPLDQRRAIGRLLMALAAADGVVTNDEVRALRRAYSSMGLDKAEADEAVAALTDKAEKDEPPTVQPGTYDVASGEAIPAPPTKTPQPVGLMLNRAAIASIMNDTREVAQMLAAAMQADACDQDSATTAEASTATASAASAKPVAVQPDVIDAAGSSDTVVTTDPTLPARYAKFYELLLVRGDWAVAEAEATARQHGHMLSGAIETLNEWSCERYGGPLFVEDGDRLIVERELLN